MIDGKAFGGHRHDPTTGNYIREDLTNPAQNPDYPDPGTVCAATISSQDKIVNFKVITTNGDVWELQCTNTAMNLIDCGTPENKVFWKKIMFTDQATGPFLTGEPPNSSQEPSNLSSPLEQLLNSIAANRAMKSGTDAVDSR
ncbi:hypothetical protein OHA79_29110 [Streptomyces sp. NBC_00841]|nr:hypothetical protein [Streptomyces sp. NBC_01669]WSA01545.1 hypothetical protein OHA79_29110 [Streptomyces sp. NBC_00841]